MARKTVSLEWLKNKVNELLALSDDQLVEQRKGAAAVLEAALFETHNYKGFSYLPENKGDETRRRYS